MKVYLPKINLLRVFVFSFIFFLLALTAAEAQYCSPTISTGGIYLSQVNFNYGGIAGGHIYPTGSGGYTQTVGSSSGTVSRYYGGSISYNIQNSTASGKTYYFAIFADWNNNGLFDAGELISSASGTIPANSNTGTSAAIIPPLTALTGNVRIRIAVSQIGVPTACGSFTGEVEDYILTIPANIAPVLNTSATPFLSPLLTTQTSNNGTSVGAFVSSATPNQVLIADVDDQSVTSPVPRGIAIYAQSAPNGTWQYHISGGSWTNFGAVSGANSLLLLGDASAARIRFVPSGVGVSSFSYRAWDGTSGISGSSGSSAATGGSTAFSSNASTGSITVYAPASLGSGSVYFSTNSGLSLFSSSIDEVNGLINLPDPLPSAANSADYTASDIAYDAGGSKLFWLSLYSASSIPQIFSSNVDGTGKLPVLSFGALDNPAGLAAGDGKVFYGDYAGVTTSIFSVNPDGSGNTKISGAGKIDETDMSANGISSIKFHSHKIYIATGDQIIRANTDGSSSSVVYTSSGNFIAGLSATADTLYWTENDPTFTTGYIKKLAIAGGTAATVASQSGATGNYSYNGLVVDSAHSTIYVVSSYFYAQGNNALTAIKKVSLGGGSVTNTMQSDTGLFNLAFNTNSVPLPVTLTSLTAYKKGQDVDVEWKTVEEQGVQRYDVQRSADAARFAKIGDVTASGLSDYIFRDLHPLTGNNFYRLYIVDMDGNSRYSPIVNVNTGPGAQGIRLYPNPCVNHTTTLQFSNMPAGQYKVDVFAAAGQNVYSQVVSYNGGPLGQTLLLPQALATGIYKLQVRNEAGRSVYVNSFILQ